MFHLAGTVKHWKTGFTKVIESIYMGDSKSILDDQISESLDQDFLI